MERFNRLKELINEYNQPATLSPVIVPEDGLSFFHSLQANINLNRDLLGDTSYLQQILASDGQHLRSEWVDECKEILKRCNRSDELIEQWDQVWEQFKKIGFKSSDELNKLFLMFSAYKTRRHLVMIDDSSDNTSNSSDFIILVSGDMIHKNNVVNSSPILLCRVESQDHRQHFQPLISTDSQFWRQFCEENIRYNKTGSNFIIIKRQNIDSRNTIQIKKEQLHDKPQELPNSFDNESQIRVSEETLNHHLIEVNDGYNVKEIKKEQSIEITKELTDITDLESHSWNDEDIMKVSMKDPLQNFQSVQDVDNTPKLNIEPVLEILVKEESLLEPSEVKTEPLEYPQPYLLPNFDIITIKKEVKTEPLDYNYEQDCGLYPIVNTCKAMEEDPEELREEENERKRRAREKHRLSQQAYKRRKMEEDPEGFREKHNESRRRLKMKKMQEDHEEEEKERIRRYRMEKMKEDPEGFREEVNERKREKRRLRQQAYRRSKMEDERWKEKKREKDRLRIREYRRRKMEEDPKGVREEDPEEEEKEWSRRYRMKKMKEDPEGFREILNERKREKTRLRQQAYRRRKKEQDPEFFKLRNLEYRRRKMEEDPEGIRVEVNERKREKERLKQQAYYRRKMEEDPEGFRKKHNEKIRRYRMKKMKENPEGFREEVNERNREKARLRQQAYKRRKMEEDPEVVREEVNERKRTLRFKKIEQDPEGFRNESKVENEESKHKAVDYREGDFMGHQMESSDSYSEGDENSSSYEYISEEKDEASIEEDNNKSA